MTARFGLLARSLIFASATGLAVPFTHSVREVLTAPSTPPSSATVVVELFTSEGCSSCPPADDLLRSVAHTPSVDGQRVITLSEHVTYWNRLGWTDPFSQEQFTERQDRYRSNLHLDEVYTPQAIVNGREQFVGNNRAALEHALHTEARRSALGLELSRIRRSGDALEVEVRVGETSGQPQPELWAVIVDDTDTSVVSRGENAGRTLRHASVVRFLTRLGPLEPSGIKAYRISLPSSVLKTPDQPRHLALLAQLPGQGGILGATEAAF